MVRLCLTCARGANDAPNSNFKEVKMGSKHGTPGQLVFRRLMSSGGAVWAHDINMRSSNRSLLKRALPELGDLVAIETVRDTRSGRRRRRILITLQGLAAAKQLDASWAPSRLATPILQAWLTDLQSERDPWALKVAEGLSLLEWKATHDADIIRGARADCRPLREWVKEEGALGVRTYAEHRAKVIARARARELARVAAGGAVSPRHARRDSQHDTHSTQRPPTQSVVAIPSHVFRDQFTGRLMTMCTKCAGGGTPHEQHDTWLREPQPYDVRDLAKPAEPQKQTGSSTCDWCFEIPHRADCVNVRGRLA
jgi:hypothetical protein